MSMFGYGNNSGYGYQNNGGFNVRLIIGLIIAVVAVVGYFNSSSINPVTGEKQHVSMSPDQETQLGLAAAPQMISQMGGEANPNDPEADEVRYVGNRVWQNSDAARSPYQYQYHLLSDPATINAFALPGGQVFITRGLYEKLADEAELAGVLGHETGHVVERHSAQQAETGQLGRQLVTAVAVGASNRRNGFATAMLADVVNNVTQLKFSRADESQADTQGLRFMAQAGFDPRAMIDVMKVLLQAGRNGRQPEFLSTHPYPEDRMKEIDLQLRRDYPNGYSAERGNPLPR